MSDPVPPEVQTYLDGIAAEHRPMWDRIEALVRVIHPDAQLRITYSMPTLSSVSTASRRMIATAPIERCLTSRTMQHCWRWR